MLREMSFRVGCVVALAALLPGCPGEEPPPCPESGEVLLLEDEANFDYSVDLVAETELLAAGEDATISWEDLTQDMLGHPLDPSTEVDSALLVVLDDITPDEVASALATDDLQQSQVTSVFECEPTGSGCALSEFTFFGTELDIAELFAEDSGTWMVSLRQEGQPVYSEFKKLMFVQPSDSSDRHEATFENESSQFSVQADLSSLEPVIVPDGMFSVDWTAVTRTGLNYLFDASKTDLLWVAHFPDRTVADLEVEMVDLEIAGQGYWQMEVEGAQMGDLSQLQPVGDSAPFSGVDDNGTWLLGLRCSTCRSPMPHFLTVLSRSCE